MIEDILRSMFNADPSQRRIQQDVERFREETEDWRGQLIPWEEANELGLLSLNHNEKWVKKGPGKFLKGVLFSIYNEPMVVFSYKNYIRNGLNAVLWAQSYNHRFMYRCKKQRTEFYIDGDKVGHMTLEGLIYGGTRKRLLGRRNNFSSTQYSAIIWDREVAHINKPDVARKVNPRAFEMLADLGDKEQLLLLSLGLVTVVNEIFDLDLAPAPIT